MIQTLMAALAAIPKIVDLLNALIGQVNALAQAQMDAKTQEIINTQNELTQKLEGVMSDQQRALFAEQINNLNQRIVRK